MKTRLENEFAGRLVGLQAGEMGLRGGLQVITSVPADVAGEPVVDFISSDETLDRYNEIICASGWKLDRYARNPVFQDSHDYSTILRTIGRATATEVRGNQLFQRVCFAVEANPLARIAYSMYRSGFLNAVSVGFIPLEWENGNGHTSFERRYLKQELLETSAVAIPANPNALECAIKAGAVGKSELKELLEVLRGLAEGHSLSSPVSNPNLQNHSADPSSDAQLMQLMREVAAICRRA